MKSGVQLIWSSFRPHSFLVGYSLRPEREKGGIPCSAVSEQAERSSPHWCSHGRAPGPRQCTVNADGTAGRETTDKSGAEVSPRFLLVLPPEFPAIAEVPDACSRRRPQKSGGSDGVSQLPLDFVRLSVSQQFFVWFFELPSVSVR